jgi:hypothetical protein
MTNSISNYPKSPLSGKRDYNARRFLNLILAGVFAFSIVLTESGCGTSKKVAAAKAKADADAKAKADADASAKKQAAADAAAAKAAADAQAAAKREPYDRVGKFFQQISGASDVNTANQSINSALSSFKTADVPVLIIIYRKDKAVDYDKPTTISKYLNFLKDQKKNPNTVDHLEMDNTGKITEIVLIKK